MANEEEKKLNHRQRRLLGFVKKRLALLSTTSDIQSHKRIEEIQDAVECDMYFEEIISAAEQERLSELLSNFIRFLRNIK